MTKITILGLGSMGAALARCLIGAGYDVGVWNRTAAKTGPLAELGATAFETVEAAVGFADLSIFCIKGHRETLALVGDLTKPIKGKVICDCSTGDTADAETLAALLEERGAGFLLGMINSYPSGIGGEDTAILTVGHSHAWDAYGDVIRTMGGKSALVGDRPASLAALFAGLFSVRQGFMFGMIYGALVCKKAGIPMQVFSDQIPASLKMVHDYYALFERTVPPEDFDNAEASMQVYALAQHDALKTFQSLGAPDDFIDLMYRNTKAACDDGFADKQMTALTAYMAT